ncbi:MAG: integral rane protein-like protein [Deltaproteobacteria bacterium]|nr:integral rane protein-like protein [Deltaproteobacteria bacterium]
MAVFFAATIFLGSFLLFQVELIIAKIILPWFGGAAAVWTTCMLFFQVMLLLGYLYAHGLARCLRPKSQFVVHLALLCAAALLLPILPGASWKPVGADAPLFRILALLTAVVGLPFFLLSSTSPLLSHWFARSFPGASPYWLYAMSNLGSMLGLLSYPTVVEPNLSIKAQAYGWSGAFLAFSAMCVFASVKGASGTGAAPPAPSGTGRLRDGAAPTPGARKRFFWIALPACGSVLLLGVTNHLAQNVISLPFLWVLPLSLYLLSFVLAFWSPVLYPRSFYMPLLAASVVGMSILVLEPVDGLPLKVLLSVFCVGMFAGCMVCHGELARMAPDPEYLTPYYLAISLGGALGGIFVAVAAPLLFRSTYELPAAIAACAVLSLAAPGETGRQPRWQRVPLVLACIASIAVVGHFTFPVLRPSKGQRMLDRNFYGVLKVSDQGRSGDRQRVLYSGSVNHGTQFLVPDRRREPTTFYHRGSGVGLAIRSRAPSAPIRVGAIGLGAGIIATYGRPGDTYRFYEINPLVVEVANGEFTFLRDSRANVEVVLGDARLSMEREPAQGYDILVVDAFSGDTIPAHLLTREAIRLYLRHLDNDGILAFHITNWHIDLKPVLRRLADETGLEGMVIATGDNRSTGAHFTEWVLLTPRRDNFLDPMLREAGRPLPREPVVPPWTDDYSSLIPLLEF